MITTYKPDEGVLIYDLETKTFGAPDGNRDILKFFGSYSFKTNKYYLLTNKEDIQKIVNAHKFLVGFNTEEYDEPILKRFGIDIQYKIRIDLRQIVEERAGTIKIKEGILNDLLTNYSLDFITKTLHLVDEDTSKMKFDYNILNKDSWTKEELQLIRDYTIRDLEITKKLYEWLEEYFWSAREFLSEEDVTKKRYLTVSTAKLTYKAICKAMNWTEEYLPFGTTSEGDKENILGGYVAYPSGEEFHKCEQYDLYLFDFASLYPHVIMQANLFGRKKENTLDNRPIWDGKGIWKTHGIYYEDDMSGVGKLIKRWYSDRIVFKKEQNPKEYMLKIFMNAISGIMETEYYVRVCDRTARKDCTGLGRQWSKYVRKEFRKEGYTMIYTDTDSFFILDPLKVVCLSHKILLI
jgi:DNA polymerase elongation subunit (family B)